MTFVPLASMTPSKFVSQPVATGALPPLTMPLRVCVAPVRKRNGPVVSTTGRGSVAAGDVTTSRTSDGAVAYFRSTAVHVPGCGLPTETFSGLPGMSPSLPRSTPDGS